MIVSNEQLNSLLVKPGHLTEEQLGRALTRATELKQSVLEVLVKDGYISDDHLGQTLADSLGLRFVSLHEMVIDKNLLQIIPEAVASSQQVVVYNEDDERVAVATTNPNNYEFFELLEKKTGKRVDVALTTAGSIGAALRGYKSDRRERAEQLVQSLTKQETSEEGIIELVNLVMEYAYDNGASDIHIEPLEESSSVRFRIDGILHEILTYPKPLHEKIIFRLKIMSRLRTDEHAATQDGRFEYAANQIKFDVRVSVVPTTRGENVVMRLLTTESAHKVNLSDLGYSPAYEEMIKKAILKPHGMILSVGPTGSGKSTTLYTLLQLLNSPEVNVMTIEDPVEYNIEHIQQIPVNVKKNVTFSTGLRSIVRQDPDIIMVGEIRDTETANIAVNAAMTGHLLLSTLHANDAATTFPRLIDLGVEPFLVASSLNIVIAQRLVRRICDKCRESYVLPAEEQLVINQNPELLAAAVELSGGKAVTDIRLYRGRKCDDCNQTGYQGRIGIFEVFEMNEELRSLVIQKASAGTIEQAARAEGRSSMAVDGLRKAFQGITTLAEIIRVTKS
ncbi:MAG: hypothetical protein A2589_01635 [Candidatus Vogelbacteria bacterium RIFOXYD1_FULL_46_19]|uniref:Bacterial type II secretion system protein E domain-containing protein n=1 Tax=Candidatus Vogelbacteria bacterium RIFOXYD1_FULL_46_19 TaxID=1802439 RepID=A0A1G2QFZ5_9BACT|nr:MAG: hypothetical protein A2589_01635 [Candidatus Vogelbacteria bacterium RIFOXYD1_FULL_46_19]